MLRQSELADTSESASVETDPAVYDPAAEWFVPGLTPFRGELPDDEDDHLGVRSLLERPQVLVEAWRATERRPARR